MRMKLRSFLSALSIRSRVLLLALVPIVLITLLLSSYMITSKLNQERTSLLANSQSIIRYLAAGAEFGMFSNNISALSSLSKSALERSDINDVIFINRDKEVIYRTGSQDISRVELRDSNKFGHLEPVKLTPHRWTIQFPVLLAGIQIDDFAENPEASADNRHIGWVLLIIDEQSMLARQNKILYQGILITLTGLLLTLWLAMQIGRSITQPIQAITETIERLRREELNARVSIDSKGELGELQSGINNLAKRVQDTRLRLEDQVSDATRSLRATMSDLERKNTDLDTAKQRAEKANQAKDQFLARMSHELRTPLTSVIGFSQLLQKTPLDNQQQEYSSIVQRTSSLLLHLIDDILDFSKLQSEAIRIENIAFDLEECLSDVLEMQTPLAAAKDINLYYVPAPNLPATVYGDPTRIRQIVTNLIGNAVKFTETGSVSLYVKCHQTESHTDLHIKVKDTGIGISSSQMMQLFQPFSQADTTISRRFGGSGLGLVICRHLARLMGGELALNSTPNEGTEVNVYLRVNSSMATPVKQPFPDYHALAYEKAPETEASISQWLEHMQVNHCHVDSTAELLHQLMHDPQIDMLALGFNNHESQGYKLNLLKLIRRHFNGIILLVGPTGSDEHCSLPAETCQQLQPVEQIRHPLSLNKLTSAMDRRSDPREHIDSLSEQREASQKLHGLNVLVAEDNAFNRLLLERLLSFAGATVTQAANGEKALVLARQTRYDCILMDVHMPAMDGIEASRLIHDLPAPLGDVPIIALTANVIANEAKALQEVGVETTLFKPINEAEIIFHIQQLTGTLPASQEEENIRKKPRLGDYGISEQELWRELDTQIQAIHKAYREQNTEVMRDHSHQLIGLAGLLDLVILEAAAALFNQSVKTDDWKEIWQQLWHLQRVINNLNLQED